MNIIERSDGSENVMFHVDTIFERVKEFDDDWSITRSYI